MTEERIRELLRDLATQAPTMDLVSAAWRQADRVRKRRQAAVGAVAATAVTAGGFVVVPQLGGPGTTVVQERPTKDAAPDQKPVDQKRDLSPYCSPATDGGPPLVPSQGTFDLVPVPTPERMVAMAHGDSPWAIVDGRIAQVDKPKPERPRIEVQLDVDDLIHESEPDLVSGDRVGVVFWQGATVGGDQMACTLDDWRYALPVGTRMVVVLYQPPGRDALAPNVTGLFFEKEHGNGIRGGIVELRDLGGKQWQRIGSLDELAQRFRDAVADGG